MDDYYFCYFPYCLVFSNILKWIILYEIKMWKNVNDIYTSIRDYVKRKKVLWMVTNVKTVEEALLIVFKHFKVNCTYQKLFISRLSNRLTKKYGHVGLWVEIEVKNEYSHE